MISPLKFEVVARQPDPQSKPRYHVALVQGEKRYISEEHYSRPQGARRAGFRITPLVENMK